MRLMQVGDEQTGNAMHFRPDRGTKFQRADLYARKPRLDVEDGPNAFGPHSDLECILDSESYRLARFQYGAAVKLSSDSH